MKSALRLGLLPVGSHYKSILSEYLMPEPLPQRMKAWVTYRGGNMCL